MQKLVEGQVPGGERPHFWFGRGEPQLTLKIHVMVGVSLT